MKPLVAGVTVSQEEARAVVSLVAQVEHAQRNGLPDAFTELFRQDAFWTMPYGDPLNRPVAEGSVDSAARLAAAALLKLVDSGAPPLRLPLGSMVYDLAFDIACKRTDTWAAWGHVSRAAEQAIAAPTPTVEEAGTGLQQETRCPDDPQALAEPDLSGHRGRPAVGTWPAPAPSGSPAARPGPNGKRQTDRPTSEELRH
ncbi:hypothetical protein [Streptomyces sp. NPDC046161]|uniref:hypothetical protein n=1 Tax=Streptomyces sp. NPDC046161 TaxID=3155132 RepID=UPI0033F7804C